jgi:hypothetical protein
MVLTVLVCPDFPAFTPTLLPSPGETIVFTANSPKTSLRPSATPFLANAYLFLLPLHGAEQRGSPWTFGRLKPVSPWEWFPDFRTEQGAPEGAQCLLANGKEKDDF